MNTRLNLVSNATKAKSLVTAVTVVVGLQGALLWQMNEVANSGAQSAMLAAQAPATVAAKTPPTPAYQITLEPRTIVARRDSNTSRWTAASMDKRVESSVVDSATNAMLGTHKPVYLY